MTLTGRSIDGSGAWALDDATARTVDGGIALSSRKLGRATFPIGSGATLVRASLRELSGSAGVVIVRGGVTWRILLEPEGGSYSLVLRRGAQAVARQTVPFTPARGAPVVVEAYEIDGASPGVVGRAWRDDGLDPRVAAVLATGEGGGRPSGRAGIALDGGGAVLERIDAFRVRSSGSLVTGSPGPVAEPSTAPDAAGAPPGERGAGSARLASYPSPAGSVFVATDGSDSAPGTSRRPKRTIAAAVDAAPRGGTVVVRAGTYHESVTLPSDSAVRLQSAAGEAVWLDGSRTVTGWTESGSGTWSAPWSTVLDSSPTYTRGAPDNAGAYRGFVNPERPLAARPDQVWIGSTPLEQVASAAEVRPGRFAVDSSARRLVIGDDPGGRVVRSSDLSRAVTVRTADGALRGIGVRRFAPSVPDLGAVRCEFARALVENVVIEDSATTGLFVTGSSTTVRSVTVLRSGLIGMTANKADRLRLIGVRLEQGNTQGFNLSPVAGGVKVTKSRHVLVADSVVDRNDGPGIWLDESVYDGRVLRNRVTANTSNGIVLEISSRMLVGGNLVVDSGRANVKVNNTDRVELWNNTLVGGARGLWIVQDERRASDVSIPGHDPRRPVPDPDMTWVTDRVTVANNVLADASTCLLCVQDTQNRSSGRELGVRSFGNVLHRAIATSAAVVWPAARGYPALPYRILADWVQADDVDAGSADLTGTPVFEAGDVLVPRVADQMRTRLARPPSEVVDALGPSARTTPGALVR